MRTVDETAVNRHELLFRVTKSMFYHSQRAHLLKILNQFIGVTTILVNIGSVAAIPAARIKVLCNPIISSVQQPVGCFYPAFETLF